jgi:hypothetical protein
MAALRSHAWCHAHQCLQRHQHSQYLVEPALFRVGLDVRDPLMRQADFLAQLRLRITLSDAQLVQYWAELPESKDAGARFLMPNDHVESTQHQF